MQATLGAVGLCSLFTKGSRHCQALQLVYSLEQSNIGLHSQAEMNIPAEDHGQLAT